MTSTDCGTNQICDKRSGCIANGSTSGGGGQVSQVTIISINANADGTFTITGTQLGDITALQISGGALTATPLTVTTSGASTIIATASASLVLAIDTAYDLLVSTADATGTVSVTFTLPSNVVTTPAGCGAGQVLGYDGTHWTCVAPGTSAGSKRLLVAGPDWVPLSTGTPWQVGGTGIKRTASTQGSAMIASVRLPEGSIPTSVTCYLDGDGDSSGSIVFRVQHNDPNDVGSTTLGNCKLASSFQGAFHDPLVLPAAASPDSLCGTATSFSSESTLISYWLEASSTATTGFSLYYCAVTYTPPAN